MIPDTTELQHRLKNAGAWTRGPYLAHTPLGCELDSAPFEAADMLSMQARGMEVLGKKVAAVSDILVEVVRAVEQHRQLTSRELLDPQDRYLLAASHERNVKAWAAAMAYVASTTNKEGS